MRVLLASRIFLPEAAAASFRLEALVRALRSAGHEVEVLTARTPGRMGRYDDAGVRVRRFAVLRNADGYVRGIPQYLSFDIPLVPRLLTARRPDVIVVEPPPTTGLAVRIVAALRRIPYVYYAADIWSDAVASIGQPRAVEGLLRALEVGAFRRARRVVAVNDGVAARVRELAPHADVVTVGNGVDTEVFRPEGPVADERPYAIYAGTMSEWQGVDVFLHALAQVAPQLPEARIVFLGQGTAQPELKRLAGELGVADRVEFRDTVPAAEAAAWIRGARLSLVSLRAGTGYDFALPTKVMASLATGTPVLFSGAAESPVGALLRSAPAGMRAGLATSADPGRIADALRVLYSAGPSPEERSALGGWAASAVSLAAVAARVAAVVEASAR